MSDICACCGAHNHPRMQARNKIRGFLSYLKRHPEADPQDPTVLQDYIRTSVAVHDCAWCEKDYEDERDLEEGCTCFLESDDE